MVELCHSCATDTARGSSGLCRYCALQRAGPAAIGQEPEAVAPERVAWWELVGEVLLWVGVPAFVIVIGLAEHLAHP
jgi:hypothetical protein